MRSIVFGFVTASIFAAAAPLARPQCGPDGLNNAPCCSLVLGALPAFPSITLPALGACWTQCGVDAQVPMTLTLGPPFSFTCGEYMSVVIANSGSFPGTLSGVMQLDYTRTWIETPVVGQKIQVWRFAVKIDMSFNGPPPFVCPVPFCLINEPTAFFYGYVDYALDCANNTWESAVVLFHNCDTFIHQPVLSSHPGVYHPGRMYAMVAPNTSATPFVPNAFLFPNGPLVAEGVRDVIPPIAACVAEEHLTGGIHQRVGVGCLCPAAASTRLSANIFNGVGSCPDTSGVPSSFTSVNVPGTPWIFLMKTSLGAWVPNSGTAYPGKEAAYADEGVFIYHDSCFGAGLGSDTVDFFYGGSTKLGFPTSPVNPGSIVTDRFIDIANNYSAPLAGPYSFPVVGNVSLTTRLIYANVP